MSARERSPLSPTPPVRLSGRKHHLNLHLKLAGNENKQSPEIGSKREKRRGEARRKDSAHLLAASCAGEYLAPGEVQISTCSRPADRPSHSVISMCSSFETRKQCPAVLDSTLRKHGCGSSAMPLHLISSSASAQEAEPTEVRPHLGMVAGASSVELPIVTPCSNMRISCEDWSSTRPYIVSRFCSVSAVTAPPSTPVLPTTLPRCLQRTAPNKHCSNTPMLLASKSTPIESSALPTRLATAVLGSAPSVRTRAPSRTHHEPFGDYEPAAGVVPVTVPMLSADNQLCSSHSRSTCEVLPLPMLSCSFELSPDSLPATIAPHPTNRGSISHSESSIAHPALTKYINYSVVTLTLHSFPEISRIPDENVQAPVRLITVPGITRAETPSAMKFLVSFESSIGSMMDAYAPLRIDSVTLSYTISPRKRSVLETSPMSVSGYIRATWAARRMFPARFWGSIKDPPLWRTLCPMQSPTNQHTADFIPRTRGLFMTSYHHIYAASAVAPSNSSLGSILTTAHSVRSHYLIGRTPVFKPCAGIAAATMLGRSLVSDAVQGSILPPATLLVPNLLKGLSLLWSCSLRINVAATRHHLSAHRCGVLNNSKALCQVCAAPKAISRACVQETSKDHALCSNAPFMAQTQYNSGSPEYISSVLEEVLLPSIGSKCNSQLAVGTVTIDRVNVTGAIGAAHAQCNTMIWVYPELIRVNSENSAGAESWHRQHCNTLSCVTQQYNLAKMAKDKDGNIQVANHRGVRYMSYKMGLTHTREHSDNIRRGIKSRRGPNTQRVSLVSMNSDSIEAECWHHQQHNLFMGATNYKPLRRANSGWIRNGGVIHHPSDRKYRINVCAGRVPIATPLADFPNEMNRGLLGSAYFARHGLNNSTGTPMIMLLLHGAPDVSHKLGPGKLRKPSEDTQKIFAHRLEEISSASCALLLCPLAELDEFQTCCSWSLGVDIVLDALVKLMAFMFRLFLEQQHWNAISGDPLRCSTKCCLENNSINLRITLASAVGEVQKDKITGRNLIVKMARSQQMKHDHVYHSPSESAEVPPSLVKQRAFDIHSTRSMILGKVPNSEYCSEYQARTCPVYTIELLHVRDRAARVQQRENFETLEIGGGSKAADKIKQTQILRRSLGSHQPSVGLYLNYLLVAQKFSSNCSLSRFTAYGASKLRNHSLQAPEYGAVGQYSKTSSKERNETRSGHPDESSGHPVMAYSLFCSTSPSPPPLAAQSLPANHSSSLGVPISHHQRADGYASPLDSSGSMEALLLPSLSPNPPPELVVLRSSSDHPHSSCLAPTYLSTIHNLQLRCTELCSGINTGSSPLQFVATSTTSIRAPAIRESIRYLAPRASTVPPDPKSKGP
ncbi:hypothetical protein B0H13DRAFT_1874190 [Mycena leptocephala]|nr:hypothetical protein B0H13DRAFT_1874190 [Mycena leptocephala]